MSEKITFQHAGPIARDFFYDDSEVACIVGPFGSGKSSACVQRLKRIMHQQEPDANGIRDTRILIARNTFPQLRDATLPTWLRWFPQDVYGAIDSKMRHIITGKLPDGTTLRSEVLFRAFDDPVVDLRNLLSLDLTYAWLNECREVPFDIFNGIMSRVGRWPAAGKATRFGALLDSNPWHSESEYHRTFVIEPRPGYRLFHQPSGVSPEAENLANLPGGQQYYRRMEERLADKPDQLKVDCYSEWGALRSGQVVYSKYTDSVHCKPFEVPKGAPLRIGVDFGIRACAAVLMYRSPVGVHYAVDEVVSFEEDLPRFADAIKARLSGQWAGHPLEWGVGDPAGNQRNLSGQTAFDIARSRGLHLMPAQTNELSVRLAAVTKLLVEMAPNGTPAFQLHPRCKWLRDGFLFGYKFAQQRGSGKIADIPEKNDFSHVQDALGYVALRSVGSIFQAHGNGSGVSHDQFLRAATARNQEASRGDWVLGNRAPQRGGFNL